MTIEENLIGRMNLFIICCQMSGRIKRLVEWSGYADIQLFVCCCQLECVQDTSTIALSLSLCPSLLLSAQLPPVWELY